MSAIPKKSELDFWLREHATVQPMSLRDWISACSQRTRHNTFVQLFIYDYLGGDKGILKTHLKPATHEVARHQGIIGDWSVQITGQLLEATIIFNDSVLAKIILIQTGDATMSQEKSLTKAEMDNRIRYGGDTVVNLFAWTRKQPRTKVAAIYNLKSGIWEQMMEFRNDRLAKLPDVVTKETVRYLYHSTDRMDWMLYSIIMWNLYRYTTFGLEKAEGKNWVISYFKQIQHERMSSGPFVFKIVKRQGNIIGFKRKWPAK